MEEEVLQSLYTIAKENGYMKDSFEFQKLMNDDEEARKTMYDLSLQEGYEKSFDDFTELVTPSKKKIEERIKERELEYGSHPGLLERSEFDDEEGGLNPLISAVGYLGDQAGYTTMFEAGITTGSIQSELSQQIFPLLTNKDKFTEEQIERLISINEQLKNAPQSESRKKFDKNYYEALSEVNKKIADNPYGDLELIESNFKQGKFSQNQNVAYEDYRKTGVLNKELLPKREVTFLDDLGAFFEATSKGGMPTAMGEIAISSLVSMFTNPAVISAGAATGGAAALAAAPTVVGTGIAGTAGFFAGASSLLDTTLRFNEYLNETLAEQGLEPNKENYKKILEDDELIQKLQIKALKGGLTVGAIDGVTTLLGASVAAKTASKGMQVAGRFKRAATVGLGGVAGTLIDASGGALGEAAAQAVTGEKRNTRAIIDEFFAEVPSAFATSSFAVGNEVRKSYKIKGKEVTKETFTNTLEALDDSDLANADLSTNDSELSKNISNRKKRQGIKENLDPSIPSNKVERIIDKELEIQKLDGKKSHTAKKKISQLKKDIDAIQEETVEDIEMSDLEQTLRDQGVQFQLSAEATPEEKKAELLDIAVKQIKEAQAAEISEDVYKANQIDVEKTKIDYSSQPLAEGVPQVSADTLVDKLINLVMADQLMVGEIKTSSGKVLQRKGGMFFSLIPELKDKIAWASIDITAARNIVRGAIKSDETVVFNMNPSAIDSNVALVEYAFQEIQGRAKDQKAIFNSFKDYLSGLKLSDQAKDFLSKADTFKELVDNFATLNTKDRATIAQNALPTETKESTIPYYKELIELGITIESSRDANIEPAIKGAPMGAMLSILEITDENGNRITDEADIDKAIVSREQAIKEGLPIHENYPFYIRGKHKALINDTAPFWNYMPDALDKIDLKIAGVIRTATKRDKEGRVLEDRQTTSREARASAQRAGTMSSATAQRVSAPDVTQYEKFVNMVSKSFPSINVVTNETEFSQFRDDIYARQMITKDQKVYGAVRGNTLYINPDLQNFNTPIHEFGHIWINTIKEEVADTYNTGISLIKGSVYEKRIRDSKQYTKVVKEMKKNGFSDAEVDSYILEEALATAIGDKGEAYVKASTLQKFRQWLQNLYDFIKTKLGISQYSAEEIENLSLDEFTEAVAVDILKGEPLFEESQVKTIDELQLQLEDSNIYEIIRVARNNGFPDSVIEKFLQKKGFKKKEIAEAKKINVNALQELPASFYNATDTAIDGLNLFEKAFEYAKKRVKKYGSSKAIELTTDNLIKKSPIFKKSNDITKEEMIRDFGKFMGKKFKSAPAPERVLMGVGRAVVLSPTEKSKSIQDEYIAYKRRLKTLNEGARNLQTLQREVRNYVRKNIPRSSYNKSTVNKLMRLITDAKTDVDVSNAIDKANDIIVETNSNIVEKALIKLLNLKTVSKRSGRAVARSVSPAIKERLDRINSFISKDLDNLALKVEEIKDIVEKSDAVIALEISNALNNEDKADPSRLQGLSFGYQNVKDLVDLGRSELSQLISERSQRLAKDRAEIYESITGIEYVDTEEGAKQRAKYLRSKEQKEASMSKFEKISKGVVRKINDFFIRQEDLSGKLDILLKIPGEVVGGRLEEIITDRLDASSIKFKQGKMALDQVVLDNAKRIFGKKYKNILHKNATVKVPLIIGDETYSMTQNEMYPMIMNMKDSSLRAGYEARFGDKLNQVVEAATKALDPRVMEWAKWQVNEFYPATYDRYNPTYKRMYYTNMPFNKKYMGRVYREQVEKESFDLLNPTKNYRSAVGSASTKARVVNKKRIELFDGDNNLSTYIRDMEYWNAYSESIRDIGNYMYDADISDAIKHRTNSDVLKFLQQHIGFVATKGIQNSAIARTTNWLITPFILARLGLNPTIGIKQLTSAFAYSADIGPVNYVQYIGKSMPNVKNLWKEITDNSVYIKDRYADRIREQIAVYSDTQQVTLVDSQLKELADKGVEKMMWFIKTGDRGGIMGGIPNYLYYKDQYQSQNPKATEKQVIDYAIRKFEKDTKKAQQSSDIQDRDLFQLDASSRWLNAYQTSPRQYNRKVMAALRNMYRSAKMKDKKGVAKNFYKFMLFHSFLPMLYQWVGSGMAGLLRGYEDEYDDYDLLRAAVVGNINSLFVVGDLIGSIIEATEGKFYAADLKNIPLYEVARPAIKTLYRASKIKDENRRNKLYHDLFVDLLGIGLPAKQVTRYVDNIKKVSEGNFDSMGELISLILNYSDYAIHPRK